MSESYLKEDFSLFQMILNLGVPCGEEKSFAVSFRLILPAHYFQNCPLPFQ